MEVASLPKEDLEFPSVSAPDWVPEMDYIVVVDSKQRTASGITIPASARRSGHIWGKVLAVGPGRPAEPCNEILTYANGEPSPVKPGDVVFYSTGAGIDDIDGGYRIIRPHDLVARR